MATTASRGTSCRCNSTSDRSPRYGGNGWNAARARRSSIGRKSCRSWRATRFPHRRSCSATPLSAKLSHEEPDAVVLRIRICGGEDGNTLIYPALQGCRRPGQEAAVEGVALRGHVGEKVARREAQAVLAFEPFAQIDEAPRPRHVDVGQGPAGERREAEAEDRADIRLADIGDDALLDGSSDCTTSKRCFISSTSSVSGSSFVCCNSASPGQSRFGPLCG